jgi:hypothetical protein
LASDEAVKSGDVIESKQRSAEPTLLSTSSRSQCFDAICRQAAPRTARWRTGVNRMARSSKKSPKISKKASAKQFIDQPALLSGGNPQIAKADGGAPVQAYIAAMPGWKRDVGLRLDALIVRTVPGVRKAVKWNSPFYGVEGRGWCLGMHCFTNYVKVAFFRGTSLRRSRPARARARRRATSTSTRRTSSMKLSSLPG